VHELVYSTVKGLSRISVLVMFNEPPTMLQRMVSALFCFKNSIVEQLDLTFLFCFGMKAEDMEFSECRRCY